MIRCECSQESDTEWDRVLPNILVNYNNSIHSSTGLSPSENILTVSHDLKIIPSERSVKNWKSSHPAFKSFSVGDIVLKKVIHSGNSCTNKMKPRYDGSYVVKKVQSNGVSYVLKSLETNNELRAHHSQLKKYIGVPDYLKNCEVLRNIKDNVYNESNNVLYDFSTDDESDAVECDQENTAELSNISSAVKTSNLQNTVPIESEMLKNGNTCVSYFKSLFTETVDSVVNISDSVNINENPIVSEFLSTDHNCSPFPSDHCPNVDKPSSYEGCHLDMSSGALDTLPLDIFRKNVTNNNLEMYQLLSVTEELISNGSVSLLQIKNKTAEQVNSIDNDDNVRVNSFSSASGTQPTSSHSMSALHESIDVEGAYNNLLEARTIVAQIRYWLRSTDVSSSSSENVSLHSTPKHHTRSRGPVKSYPNVLDKAI